jgi:Flp pilus assembly protein TadG
MNQGIRYLMRATVIHRQRSFPASATWAPAVAALRTNLRGSAAIQFGLVAPSLLMFIFGIVEVGRMLWTMSALHYSVEEAARCASINATTCGTASKIQAFAAGRAGGSFASSVFTASVTGCGNRVSASYPMRLNIPFTSYAVTLTAQSCYPI